MMIGWGFLVFALCISRIHTFSGSSFKQQKKTTGYQRTSSWLAASSKSELVNHPKNNKSKKLKARNNQSRQGRKRVLNSIETWRCFGITVHPDDLPKAVDTKLPIQEQYLVQPVLDALYKRIGFKHGDGTLIDVKVVRRSLDARKTKRSGQDGPRYVYVLDVTASANVIQQCKFRHQPGRMERMSPNVDSTSSTIDTSQTKKRVIVVGGGPAGLFCALTLLDVGFAPIILERGQPVESRGRDIGALVHRHTLNQESNFCFGEGGAGTWSDGKLTTRIGRNSDSVRHVLETLVNYGAPPSILLEGAPHLGTDNLVRLLRNMRKDIRARGGEIRFGAKVTSIEQQGGIVEGVTVEYQPSGERGLDKEPSTRKYEGTETIVGDAVVLATGHSARDVYENLHECGVQLEAKGFATGFRVEHPQTLINDIQYGREWGPSVVTGKSVTDADNSAYFDEARPHQGRLPVPSYRLATDKAFDGKHVRGAYSFCMCPGGQIVPSSTNPEEVCVNGMSFSKRDSKWANSALVVTVAPDDNVLEPYQAKHGVLAGVAFQRDMERRAAVMGGGNLTVPVQRLTDFLAQRVSETVPSSSYRLGVKSSPCHELYPEPITRALQDAVSNYFEKTMPGFTNELALLHGVETRTSSPVRVCRDSESMQALGMDGLFPAGEGAGFAGGIVSAAVDGMVVAEAVVSKLGGKEMPQQRTSASSKSIGFNY